MKKLISAILVTIFALSFSVLSFAAPESEEDSLTEEKIEEVIEAIEAAETNTESVKEEESTTANKSSGLIVEDNLRYVALSLKGTKSSIIVKAECAGQEYTFNFNKANDYIIQDYYPTGKYKITSITSSSKDINIQEYTIDNVMKTTFDIADEEYQTLSFSVKEKKEPYIVGLVRREWFLLIALAGCVIGYKYLKNNRILPSQER